YAGRCDNEVRVRDLSPDGVCGTSSTVARSFGTFLENQVDGGCKTRPAIPFLRELLASGFGEGIELGFASGFRFLPLGLKPAFLLKAVKRGIKRALIDLYDRSGNLLQPLRDSIAVGRREGKDLEDQHVERALRDGESWGRHNAST